jgi:hypothetical protein
LGTLIGIAFVQTTLLVRQQYHLQSYAGQLSKDYPLVSGQVLGYSNQFLATLQDSTLRYAEGISRLGQTALVEAQVSAYDDVFLIISILAMFATLYLLTVILLGWLSKFRSGRIPQ